MTRPEICAQIMRGALTRGTVMHKLELTALLPNLSRHSFGLKLTRGTRKYFWDADVFSVASTVISPMVFLERRPSGLSRRQL